MLNVESKHFGLKIGIRILFSFFLLFSITSNAQWTSVGSDNFSSPGLSDNIKLTFGGDTPYVAFKDYRGVTEKASVMKYNGTSWVYVGSAGFSTGNIENISIAVDGETPYVAFKDNLNGGKVTVMKFDGTNWSVIGSAGFSPETIYDVSIVLDGSTPYVEIMDDNYYLTVYKFDGGSWITVGAQQFGRLANTSFAVHNSVPYVTSNYNSENTVLMFNDNAWVPVGSTGISSSFNTLRHMSIAFDGDSPVILYNDADNSNKATVKKFDGTNWVTVGNEGFSPGSIDGQQIVINQGTYFVGFSDSSVEYKILVMKFNGQSWVTQGGSALKFSGWFSIAANKTIPYVAYEDYSTSKAIVKRSKYPLTVESHSPSKNAVNIAGNSDVIFEFNNLLNTSTLTSDKIKIYGSQSGEHSGTISGTKTITFNPAHDFSAGEQVTVTVLPGIQDFENISMVGTYNWKFKIASAIADTFVNRRDYDLGNNVNGIETGDLDGDGDLDIITTVRYSNNFSVWKNNGDGTYIFTNSYNAGGETYIFALADVDGDKDFDLITSANSSTEISLLKNNGNGTFADKESITVLSAVNSITSADVDEDGDLDLLGVKTDAGKVSVLKNNGDGTFAAEVDYGTNSQPIRVKPGDFNGDGLPDLAVISVSGLNNYDLSILINNGNGTFATKVDYQTGSQPTDLIISDLDGDENLDIVVGNISNKVLSIHKNNGDGTFADKVIYSESIDPWGVSAGDVDGDGDLDLITSNFSLNSLTILKNDGEGNFSGREDYNFGVGRDNVISADVDGDGDIDLISSGYYANSFSVLFNTRSLGNNPTIGNNINATYNTPTTLSGNVSVSGTLTVGAQVTTGSNTIDLGTTGSISGETPANYIVGKVQTTRTVSSVQNNIGGLGISIDPQSNNLGSTVIKRETGTAENSSSIKQVWTITPTTQPSGPVTVTLTWPSTNDNSINLNDLVVYKSEDGGDTWNIISATINKDSDPRTATFTISSFSQFTVGQSGALPVEMVSFTGRESNGKVMLNWSTATESNNVGWEIESRIQESGDRSQNSGWKKVGFVAGKGTTTEKQSYSFAVSSLQSSVSIVEFRLKQMDSDGKISYSNVLTINLTPVTFGLSQNYPNPFNPVTVINYQLAADSDVRLVVYDLLGREVASLVNEKKTAGFYTVSFNATNISTGVYFYKLTAGNFSEIKKMTIMK